MTKTICGAKNRQGEPCARPAGWGTPHSTGRCKLHGGRTLSHAVAAQRERVTQAAAIMGVPTGVDPHEGMLAMLAVAYGQELWLRDEVALLARRELTGPVGGGEHSSPRYEPNVLVRMHTDAVDRVTRIAKQCADAGVAEREIVLREGMAAVIRDVLVAFAVALHLDPASMEVRAAARQALLAADNTTHEEAA